jgi:hypothetical protein
MSLFCLLMSAEKLHVNLVFRIWQLLLPVCPCLRFWPQSFYFPSHCHSFFFSPLFWIYNCLWSVLAMLLTLCLFMMTVLNPFCAAITEFLRLSSLKWVKYFFHGSGVWGVQDWRNSSCALLSMSWGGIRTKECVCSCVQGREGEKESQR